MEQKDLKDMTTSELMRVAANRVEMEGNSQGAINCLRMTVGVDDEITYPKDLAKTLSALADKIDAELAQARRSGLERAAKSWAKANGWPDFREGEDFGAWLDRCFIPRPRFEDGEPVHIGDKAEHPYTGETCTIDCINTFDGSYCLGFVEGNSASLLDRERVTRPAPEVLGADGKPIKVGETVYPIDGEWIGIPLEVSGIESPASVKVYLSAGKSWTTFHADSLTHTPPDTQESIDRDARKGYITYWECVDCSCERCPARIDGDKPWRWYHADSCEGAMVLDLLRRQRELDKRKGGAE